MTTVAEALRSAGDRLEAVGAESPRLEARRLLSHATDRDAVWVYQNPHQPLPVDETRRLDLLVHRRASGEPLPYLIGHVDFFGRSFAVDRRVLVPRPETEELLELALRSTERRFAEKRTVQRVFDVGTGSGVLAVSLAAELPSAIVVGIDRSGDALEVAALNAKRHGVRERAHFVQADLLDAIDGTADLIVANLPYVPRDVIDGLQAEVQHEPRMALDGGFDGLELYRRFFVQVDRHLTMPGLLIAEIGDDQGAACLDLVRVAITGSYARIVADASGRDRFVLVEK